MENNRYSEWIENSFAVRFIDLLLVGNVQGIGLLDTELINEFPKIKVNFQSEEDRIKKLRYITLSELWIMGAYELIRLMRDIILNNDMFLKETKTELKKVLNTFAEVRIPLVKFQERRNNRLYSGITQPKFDSVKGIGWEIIISNKEGVNTKVIYRNDLGNNFLELLKLLNKNIRAKQ